MHIAKEMESTEESFFHAEDPIAERGKIHCSITIWYTKFIPMPQAMKIPAAKAASGQGMGKIGENFGVEPDESHK